MLRKLSQQIRIAGAWGALALLVPVAASAATAPTVAHPAPARTPRSMTYARGEVVVIADEGAFRTTLDGSVHAASARMAGVLRGIGVERAREAGPRRPPGSRGHERIWILSSAQPGFDPVGASRALQATGAVLAACPNYRVGLAYTVPDDLYVIYQWYVDDSGFADIGLPFAWDVEQGDSSVVIAIMDTGVDTTHPDLAGKIWHNPGEIPGNALDDDGNGLVDDFEGWDFGTGDKDPKPEPTADASGIDVGFHGTFCAGIAAASTNNGDGIAGAGWSCRIMPLKVSRPDSGLMVEAIAGAFLYATDKGASIISMSFAAPGDSGVPEFFQELVDLATRSGTLCVAAAGNDEDSVRVYPAACEHVLSVGATDVDNSRASFSNFGSWVDVAAPGTLMWSTICQNYTFGELDQLYYVFLFNWDTVNPYMYGNGTSFACPLTAGVCGLVRSRYPALTPELVAQHVIATGDEMTFDYPMGKKVNAFRAVNLVPTAVETEGRSPSATVVRAAPNPVVGSGSIQFALATAGRARLSIFDAQGRLVRTLVDGPLAAGPHAAPWEGRDDRGGRLATGVYFVRLEAPGATTTAKVVLMEQPR